MLQSIFYQYSQQPCTARTLFECKNGRLLVSCCSTIQFLPWSETKSHGDYSDDKAFLGLYWTRVNSIEIKQTW